MSYRKPAYFVAVALLMTVIPLASAYAGNRAYPGFMATPYYQSQGSCLSRANGWVQNICMDQDVWVLLPLSADAASYYSPTVYGRRGQGVSCHPWLVRYDGSVNPYQQNYKNFVYADGRAETMTLVSVPIYQPGDTLFIECRISPQGVIFSYGWN